MQLGLVISILLHAAILGGALFSIHSRPEARVPEPEPVAVGMISPGEVTKIRQGVRTAKLLEAEAKESPKGEVAKKEAPRPKLAALAPPPPPPPVEQKAEPAAPKVAEPPPPPPAPPAEAQKQKKLEAEQQERERQAALAVEKQKAEQQKAEQLRAEEQKQAEEKRVAEQKQRADEQEKAEAAKRAEEQKLAEERKRAEEQKQAEEKRLAEEKQRAEEQKRQAELKKKRDDEKKRREAALKKKREEEKKRQEEEKKQMEAEAAKNKKWDADSISALLNKVPDKGAPPPPSESDQPSKNKGPTLGSREGRDKQISASEIAMLNGIIGTRLSQCWRLTSAGGGSDTPVVTLRWHLHPDGSLDGDPQVIERTRNDTLFELAAESAVRAVRECSPFPLPREKYNVWKTITRDFDPASMLR